MLLLSADFFKMNFFKKIILETLLHIGVSNGLESDHSVGPDLGPNCLQRFNISR